MKPPRSGDDALAQALDVSQQTAAKVRRRASVGEGFTELDASLRAEAATADLEAARSIDEEDIAEVAAADRPLDALADVVDKRAERELRARLAAHVSWAKTEDPSARTRPAREAMAAKFEREVDPDGVLPPGERRRRAEHAKKAYYLRLAHKSAQARRRKRA